MAPRRVGGREMLIRTRADGCSFSSPPSRPEVSGFGGRPPKRQASPPDRRGGGEATHPWRRTTAYSRIAFPHSSHSSFHIIS